jgi:hypothetical protein
MSMLAAGAKGVPRGGLELGASVTEMLAHSQSESMRAKRPAVLGDQPDDSLRRSEDLKSLLQAGPLMRQEAQGYAPPETAHMADQVVGNLARIGTKAGLAMAAGGVWGGGALLGVEETNTAYHDLIEKGIDPNTALKVAGVQGAATGLSVALPMVGPTVKATVGLVAAGGPGTYMAQEKLSQQILAKAGYHDEASLHNPLDPLGLVLSTLLPAAFGAAGVAMRPKPPSLSSVVQHLESGGKRYGKDGELLTSPKGAQGEMQVMPATSRDPGFGVVPAKDGSPDELARVGRDYIAAMEKRYPGEPDKALAAYNAGPGAVDAAVAKYGADWGKHMPAETKGYVAHGMNKLRDDAKAHASTDPEVVDAARTRVTNDALNRSMPDHIDALPEVMRASDEIAAGRMPEVEPLTFVYHGSPHEFDAFDMSKIGTGEGAQSYGHGLYFADSPGVAKSYQVDLSNQIAVGGKTILKANKKTGTTGDPEIDNYLIAHHGDLEAAIKQAHDDRAYVASGPNGGAVAEMDGVIKALEELRGRVEASTGGALYKVAIPTKHIDKMLDWDKPVPAELRTRLATAMIDDPRIADGLGSVRDGRDVYEAIGTAMKNRGGAGTQADVTAWLREQGIPGIRYLDGQSRAAGDGSSNYVLFDDKIPSIVERNGQPIARESNNVLPPPDRVTIEPEAKPAKGEAVQSPESQRLAKMAEESPDMKVTLPGHDKPMTLAEALETAKAEAAEEAKAATLVQAALECALSFGA